MKKILIALCSLVLAFASAHLNAAPLGTAFTYQGRLTDGANPANGTIPMVFGLWDAAMSGNNVGSPSSFPSNVLVANGLFSIDLDFGPTAFSGEARWLEIRVNGTLMTSRQRVAPAPNALYASTAGTVTYGAIQASQLGTPGAPATGQILTYNGSSLVWQSPGGTNLWSVNGNSDAYYNGGKVGVGTGAPSGRLTVATADDTTPTFITAFDGRHALIGTASEGIGISYSASTGAGYISTLAPGVAWKDLVLQARSLSFNSSGEATAFSVANNGDVSYAGRLNKLDVANNFSASIGCGDFRIGYSTRRGSPGLALVDATDTLNLNYPSDGWAKTAIWGDTISAHGSLSLEANRTFLHGFDGAGIHWFTYGTDNDLILGLRRNGPSNYDLTVKGAITTSVLTITGGADVAEPFQMSTQEIPKGAVVVIDDENAGKLKLSEQEYDHRVAGIVSGANGIKPGIALHQDGALEGGQNVALSGRVYVRADASSSPIKPGDLLTTSNSPGHAMRVTDHAKAQGAIIGKAMSALKEGKGMVLVLVSLQ